MVDNRRQTSYSGPGGNTKIKTLDKISVLEAAVEAFAVGIHYEGEGGVRSSRLEEEGVYGNGGRRMR